MDNQTLLEIEMAELSKVRSLPVQVSGMSRHVFFSPSTSDAILCDRISIISVLRNPSAIFLMNNIFNSFFRARKWKINKNPTLVKCRRHAIEVRESYMEWIKSLVIWMINWISLYSQLVAWHYIPLPCVLQVHVYLTPDYCFHLGTGCHCFFFYVSFPS